MRRGQVPDPDGEFDDIEKFALTFDGYARWGSFRRCAEAAALTAVLWDLAGAPPRDLDALRNALFFAQRAFRHTMQPLVIDGETYPSDPVYLDGQRWLRDLTRAIRAMVPE